MIQFIHQLFIYLFCFLRIYFNLILIYILLFIYLLQRKFIYFFFVDYLFYYLLFSLYYFYCNLIIHSLNCLRYFSALSVINRFKMMSELSLQQQIQKLKKPLFIQDFKSLVNKYTVIDTRPHGDSTGIIKGSYWFPGQALHCTWLPSIVDPSTQYLCVCQRNQIDEILERFVLMGFNNCIGYNNFNMKCYDGEKEYPILKKWRELGDCQQKQFLDVRTVAEWQMTGVIKGSLLVQLRKLDKDLQSIALLRQISKNKLIVISCRSGQRVRVAASILFRHGISSIALVENVENFPLLGLQMISVKGNEKYWKIKIEQQVKIKPQTIEEDKTTTSSTPTQSQQKLITIIDDEQQSQQ